MTRGKLAKLIGESPPILRGTLVQRYLKCCRRHCRACQTQGGHGPAYYLSIRGADRKTHMIYVSKKRLAEAKAGVAAWKQLKEGLGQLAAEDLARWRRKRRALKR